MWSTTFVDNGVMSQCEKIQVESQRILCLITARNNHDRHSCLGRKSLHWLPLPPMRFQLLAWPIGQYCNMKESSLPQSGSYLLFLLRTPKIHPIGELQLTEMTLNRIKLTRPAITQHLIFVRTLIVAYLFSNFL